MGVGVLSGTYSSIFIATPVLTHWKEREPAYRARRGHLIEEMGRVPTFPEDNVVARVGPDGEPVPRVPVAAGAQVPPPPEVEPAAAEPAAAPQPSADAGDGAEAADEAPVPEAEPEPLATGAPPEPARPARSERQRKRRQQRRRRKHGRNR
jgi:SecD/SecF fusion protein